MSPIFAAEECVADGTTFRSPQTKLQFPLRKDVQTELEGHLWIAFTPPSSLHLPSTWVLRLGTLLGTPSMRGLLPCLLGGLLYRDSSNQGEWQRGTAGMQELYCNRPKAFNAALRGPSDAINVSGGLTSNASTAFFLGNLKATQSSADRHGQNDA